MDALTEQNPATLFGPKLFRTARTIEKICIVEGLHHPYGTKFTAVDQLPRKGDRRVEAMARTDDKVNAGGLGRRDHTVGILNRHGQWFVHEDMFSTGGNCGNMVRMHLVRGRDIDDFDIWIGGQGFDCRVGPPAELRLECRATCLARSRRGHQLDARIVTKRGQHQHECTAKADDTNSNRLKGQEPAPHPSTATHIS